MKIGNYTDDEILEFMTEGEGRGFLGRSMYDAIMGEIERLNNIINEFEEELERESNMKEEDTCLEHNTFIDIRNTLKTVLKRLQELKGDDKE